MYIVHVQTDYLEVHVYIEFKAFVRLRKIKDYIVCSDIKHIGKCEVHKMQGCPKVLLVHART